MKEAGHDLLAWRLAAILQKLNQGERINPARLAEEFGVHKRTIQRDLLERFAFLPLEKQDGLFSLEPAYLGRITMGDIEHFAGLAGLSGLFPGLNMQFIRELFDSRLQDTLEIHGSNYEDLRQRIGDFRTLQRSISSCKKVQFIYRKSDGDKRVEVAPYRLINHAGIWYLAAADGDQPKAYAFGKIASLAVVEECDVPDPAIVRMLDQEDSIWLNEKKSRWCSRSRRQLQSTSAVASLLLSR